jgi:hypothetical protein
MVLFFLLTNQVLLSQNRVLRTIDPEGIERIRINGDQIFEIEIYAEDRETIELGSLLDGEYENDFQITTERKGRSLEIRLASSTLSYIPDDKRNAHKVVAATLQLRVPSRVSIEVVSDVGFLVASGQFKSFLADLQTGYFSFEGLADYLRAETLEGNIYLKTKNADIQAYSAHGTVSGIGAMKGPNKVFIKTVKGDINIQKLPY